MSRFGEKWFVQKFIQRGIYFIAFDFDKTLIDIHTQGNWVQSASSLKLHIRPFFKNFIELALANGIEIAIISDSTQATLVSKVVSCLQGSELIGIYCQDRYNPISKVSRMRLASNFLPENCCLIDDDQDNVEAVIQEEYNGIYFHPSNFKISLNNIIKFVDPAGSLRVE
jgi:hypothetical protein